MGLFDKFKNENTNDMSLVEYLESKGFKSAIPGYYSGTNLSVIFYGSNASIHERDGYTRLFCGSFPEVKKELEILLDNDGRD